MWGSRGPVPGSGPVRIQATEQNRKLTRTFQINTRTIRVSYCAAHPPHIRHYIPHSTGSGARDGRPHQPPRACSHGLPATGARPRPPIGSRSRAARPIRIPAPESPPDRPSRHRPTTRCAAQHSYRRINTDSLLRWDDQHKTRTITERCGTQHTCTHRSDKDSTPARLDSSRRLQHEPYPAPTSHTRPHHSRCPQSRQM